MKTMEKQCEKISIIVPCYNIEKYLARCLDSILAQTYQNYEVLCVDDGSDDATAGICDKYARLDERIRVFHIKNGGVSAARNYALSVMDGEWFSFVDADDWIEPEYLQVLYDNAIENNCAVSACNFQRDTEYVLGYQRKKELPLVLETSKKCIINYIGAKDSLQGMVWNKIYKTSCCGHLRFREDIRINEDCLYTYDILSTCGKACYTSFPLYHWFQRTDSACHSKSSSADFSPANVFLELYERVLEYQNKDTETALKKNYVLSVVKTLLYSQYEKNDVNVRKAREQCRLWRVDIWPLLSMKEKMKYILVMYLPK